METIDRIRNYPTLQPLDEMVTGTKWIHESIFRSYSILNIVKGMLGRWDSKETIQWIIQELEVEKEKVYFDPTVGINPDNLNSNH